MKSAFIMLIFHFVYLSFQSMKSYDIAFEWDTDLSSPGARRDKDGYLWVTGRIDDMLNVSGHLLSTSEVESALVEHRSVAEAAVVAHPHDIKGEALYCFITLIEVRLTAAVRSVFVVKFGS